MMLKVITMRFEPRIEGFDDTPLREFLSDKEVVSVRDYFFTRDNTPYLAVMLEYKSLPVGYDPDHQVAAAAAAGKGKDQPQEDYRELLTDENTPLFNRLRDWRNGLAKRDSMPPYLMFTNYQLAQIAQKAPQSMNGLSGIAGVGKVKLQKYGEEVLKITRTMKKNQAEEKEETPKPREKTEAAPGTGSPAERAQAPPPNQAADGDAAARSARPAPAGASASSTPSASSAPSSASSPAKTASASARPQGPRTPKPPPAEQDLWQSEDPETGGDPHGP